MNCPPHSRFASQATEIRRARISSFRPRLAWLARGCGALSVILLLSGLGNVAQAEDDPRFFVGGFYRHGFLPRFVPELVEDFDELPSIHMPSVGVEFTYHRKYFDIVTSVYWQKVVVGGAYRLEEQPFYETEILDSNLNQVMLGATFLGNIPFGKIVSLQYGVGIGVGMNLGDVRRTEAYPDGSGGWQSCSGPNDPSPAPFCDSVSGDEAVTSGQYDSEVETWSDGGPIPNVYLRFAPTIGVRIAPVPVFAIRLETGYDAFTGPFGGISLGYGF